ncbi:MBL fold metallo-hydrolase [Halomarina oriensis]|uniref:MBL fold metallo-hydrolase n=1 Tax=Halomarina oriensis TaxID=671145 RepID=A0A6B0GRS5_9EURY|nr:MBL fold metallo-hydrolase [Halomarina oriensis]MWG36369.1 MBL fold metallo-hydrolase [Halomarina oriensis]
MERADFPTPEATVEAATPTDLYRRIDDGADVTLLDVRMPTDFEEWHVDGDTVEVTNVPYHEFLDGVDEDLLERVPEGDPLVVLCAKGTASEFVAGSLADAGRRVVHLDGGMNGWARVLDRVEVTDYDGPGTVYQYQRPSSGCLSYLVVSDGEAAVVDPLRAFADRYREDAAALEATLVDAFDTHVHADHVSGVRTLEDADTRGVVPEAAADRGVTYTDRVDTVADGGEYAVGDATVEAVYTPGHTTGMTSYLVGDSLLATGDGLFVESVARPDLEDGADRAEDAARTLYETLHDCVRSLSDDTVVAPAHFGDATTPAADGSYTAALGDVVERMRALSLPEDEFVDLVLSDMPPRPANYEEIVETNLGRRTIDDDEAFELELGPNNCAASRDSLADD